MSSLFLSGMFRLNAFGSGFSRAGPEGIRVKTIIIIIIIIIIINNNNNMNQKSGIVPITSMRVWMFIAPSHHKRSTQLRGDLGESQVVECQLSPTWIYFFKSPKVMLFIKCSTKNMEVFPTKKEFSPCMLPTKMKNQQPLLNLERLWGDIFQSPSASGFTRWWQTQRGMVEFKTPAIRWTSDGFFERKRMAKKKSCLKKNINWQCVDMCVWTLFSALELLTTHGPGISWYNHIYNY